VTVTATTDDLEFYRRELTGYCYRMLGSAFEADDAVQETMLRAWKAIEGFEGRSSLRSWLYRIATNVCLDALRGEKRRALPMDLGPASPPVESHMRPAPPEDLWVTPIPDSRVVPDNGDPAEIAAVRESVRLAFVTALQHLPARQRARTTMAGLPEHQRPGKVEPENAELLAKYVDAFQRYDMKALIGLLREDALQTMPPLELWIQGASDITTWMMQPGPSACAGSILVPVRANGVRAWAQYKPASDKGGYTPWALQVHEVTDGKISRMTFFLDTERVFPLFGLQDRIFDDR
jgi:RNA polymerase sigma-70 factor (ECF subfamily)